MFPRMTDEPSEMTEAGAFDGAGFQPGTVSPVWRSNAPLPPTT